MKKSRPSERVWLGPGLWALTFIAIFVTLIALFKARRDEDQRSAVQNDAQSTGEAIELRLKGNQDYLQLLASQRASGELGSREFAYRASQYVSNHPELLNITWVSASSVIEDVAPREGNQQILGLHIDLPEPKRASELARSSRQAVYTTPFEAIQGNASFEVWVPVFRGEKYLGLFAAVYSVPRVLDRLVLENIRRQYQLSLVSATDTALTVLPAERPLNLDHTFIRPLNPPGNGLGLRLIHYQTSTWSWEIALVSLLCLASILGMAYGMWALKSDLTYRKQIEHELREAVRIRDEFLVIASHELKTPLTSLLLQLQLLSRRGRPAPDQLDALEPALRQAKRLSTLIENLLDLSRLTTGRFKLYPEKVQLSGLITEVLQQFSGILKASGSPIEVSVDPAIEGDWDRTRIEQVVLNLLTNAAKYGQGTPIQISAQREGMEAVLRVRDLGGGIAPEDQERIFGAFERAVSHMNISGFGIGLYLCRQIVEAHGGTIGVESQPGKGATFIVRLPMPAGSGQSV